MNVLAFILVVISSNGSVAMQQFADEDSCKQAKSAIGWDDTRQDFRRGIGTLMCLPLGAGSSKK